MVAGALLATGTAWAQVDDIGFVCFPSCDANDGRLVGTSAVGMATFSDFEPTTANPATLEVQLRIPATVPDGTEVTLGLFDPDGRGPTLGKVDGAANAHWDGDFSGPDGCPQGVGPEIEFRFRLCTDPDADRVCDDLLVEKSSLDADMAAADNSWWTFSTTDLASAEASNGNRFWLLEITQPYNCDLSWNMLKLAWSRPGSMFIVPSVAFAFGVPIASCADLDVIYPQAGGDFCNNLNVAGTTYDGTWRFFTQLARPEDGGLFQEVVTVWDGDFDYGAVPRADWKDPDSKIVEDLEACYSPGSAEEAAALPSLDADDLSTNINPATGVTEVPPPLEGFDFDGDGDHDAGDLSAFGLESETSAFTSSSLEFGNCYKLGSPPEDWPDDLNGPIGVFKRETLSFGSKIAYRISVPESEYQALDGLTFDVLNPSGNQEWEKTVLSAEADCDDDGLGTDTADECVSDPFSISRLIPVVVEGMDVANIGHMVFPMCISSDGLTCLDETECGPCLGKVTRLSLEYNPNFPARPDPDVPPVEIRVEAKGGKMTDDVFEAMVTQGEVFVVSAPSDFKGGHAGTLGTEIRIFVNDQLRDIIHTSCSQPIGAGHRSASCDFEVLRAWSKRGGLMCASLDPADDECPLTNLVDSPVSGASSRKAYGGNG